MNKRNVDRFGGPYVVIATEEERREMLAGQRRNTRYICETIIADNDDTRAVACARRQLADLDTIENRLRAKIGDKRPALP